MTADQHFQGQQIVSRRTLHGANSWVATRAEATADEFVWATAIMTQEFGHTFGLPDYYKRSGVNWDSRLDGLDTIMDDPATGSIRDHDKDQLEAIYARHTKND